MTAAVEIRGRKGGESEPKQPYEAPDDLRSIAKAKILLALGEGEFRGELTGRNIFLDGTPLVGANGQSNFPGVKWEFRPGSQQQTYIKGMPSVENEVSIGTELKSGAPWVRSISNPQLSAERVRLRWPALQQQKANGDVTGYRIEYAIDVATDGGSYVEALASAVDGKTTSAYERSHRIDLPAGNGWQIRVRRLTPNQNNNRVADIMQIAASTDVIDRKFKYPNTALLYIEFDASQFQNIPVISCEPYGRQIRVPSNYDPETRTYSGTWDGTFQIAWTDNPAWISYDLILSERFGTGRRINASQVDKWELYRIAQYCDQLVPDGKGGQEPRYTCNIYIQSAEEAWVVLRDLASIYRGMTYWAQGQMFNVADMPRDVDFTFTQADTVDGKFTYGSSSEKVHYTRALVSYDNPDNGYESDVTAVNDQKLQRRFGDNVIELAALGCTRETEAQRRGKWAILTNNDDRTVSFRTGLEGKIPLPGYVIGIAHSLLAGRQIGGRISAATASTVTLDRDTQVKAGDRLIVNLPSGKSQARTVQSVAERVVTVTTAYSEVPQAQMQYAIDADELAIQQFRVLSVSRPEPHIYEITGVQHDPSKFAHIDTGARLVDRPISVLPTGAQNPPETVTISQSVITEQTMAVTTMTISWTAAEKAVAYEVEWRKDSGDWVKVPRTGGLSVDIKGVYTGQYLARVRAISSMDISSIPRTSDLTAIVGKTGLPPAVSFLNASPLVFGIRLDWGFPAGAEDTLRTEIEYNTSQAEEGVLHLGDYAYPTSSHTMTGLAAGVRFWFRARLVDRTGNIGPWSDWVMGQSSADATAILEYITGQITETQLGENLLDRIDLIDGDGPGSVNERIQELADNIGDIVDALAYDAGKTYLSGDTVRQGQRLFQASQNVPANTPPPNAAYWLDIGSVVETANGLAAQVQQHTVAISDIDGKVTSQASSLEALQATYRDDDGEGELADALRGAEATAMFAQEVRTRASEDYALVERITQLKATVDDEIGASITEIERVIAEEFSAVAQTTQQLQSSVGQNSAAIQTTQQTVASLNGDLSAMYSVKLQLTQDGKYYAAGMGLGIENTPTGMQSQVLFQADRFAVINTANGVITSPFVIQGGQVFISSAVIGEGTIDMAKIASALQSTNYVAGQRGWRLDKSGTFEINGSVAGQGRMQMTHRALKFWDGNDVLRVQAGDLTV